VSSFNCTPTAASPDMVRKAPSTSSLRGSPSHLAFHHTAPPRIREEDEMHGTEKRTQSTQSTQSTQRDKSLPSALDDFADSHPGLRADLRTLFQAYTDELHTNTNRGTRLAMDGSSIATGRGSEQEFELKKPEAYTQPFCDFLTDNPTVWHAVEHFEHRLAKAGFQKVCLSCSRWAPTSYRSVADHRSSRNASLGTASYAKEGNTTSLATALLLLPSPSGGPTRGAMESP
jgi:hypothetical protein